jgi:hypothetical protein
MAKYLVLIYGDEQKWAEATPEQAEEKHQAHTAFFAAAGDAVTGGHELQPSTTATTLRSGSGEQPTVTDGPFLEAKEGLGGYYLLEATDLDQAIALCRRLPEVRESFSGVEIRPVKERD